MGIGRFACTPILPLMTTQAALVPQAAGALATANYVGYLAGALAGTASPRLARSTVAWRASLAVLVVTVAAMPLLPNIIGWLLLRTVAGFASAVVFVIAVNLMLDHRPPHLPGWGGHILGRVDQTEFVRLAGQRRLARRRVGRCPVSGTVGVVVRALDASDPARGSAAFAGVRNRTARPGSGAVAALIGAVLFGPPSSGSARSPWQPDACSDSPAPWRC